MEENHLYDDDQPPMDGEIIKNANQFINQQSTIEDLTETEVAALDSGTCPDCGCKHFREGPHGGMNVNIMCDNCGAKFNVLPGCRGSFGKERIGRPNFLKTSIANPPPAEEMKPSMYGKVPDRLVSFLVQLDLSDGVSLTLDAYRRQALFDRPECAISLPCRDLAIAERLVASLAQHAWERIEGKIQNEKKRRYARIKKSIVDLVLVGTAVLSFLRAEMLRQENTREIYDELEEAVREAKVLLVEAFGFKEANHGGDPEPVRLGDAGAPAPGEAAPGADHDV